MTTNPPWVLQDMAPEWEPFTDEIEKFLGLAAEREIGYDPALVEAIVEACKVGNSILETTYSVDMTRQYRYTADGKKVYPKTVLKKDAPIVRRVPLQNFWIRAAYDDIEEANWVAKELWLTEQQLRSQEKRGEFHGVDKILAFLKLKRENDEVEQRKEELDKFEETDRELYQIFEVHLRWDIDDDDDGLQEDLIIYYHWDSNLVIGAKFAHYWHGKRPFDRIGFFPVPGRFYWQGICEMLEHIQKAISAVHNRRADNAMLANMPMFLKRRSVKNIKPGDPWYPGKIIEVNDVANDFREFKVSEVYPSTYNEEMTLRGYAERLIGMNEGVQGAAMPVTRTTATAQMALLQEQARRLDLTIRSVRKAQNSIGYKIVMLYQQFGTLGKGISWMGVPGRRVEAIFSMPRRVAEVGMGIRVNVPTSANNKQVKRESALQMFNLVTQMYNQLIPLVAQLVGPEALGPIVREMAVNAKKFMGDALESFEVSDPESVLSGLEVLARVLPDASSFGGVGANGGGEAGDEVLAGVARLEALINEAADASERGPGVYDPNDRPPRAFPPTGPDLNGLSDIILG